MPKPKVLISNITVPPIGIELLAQTCEVIKVQNNSRSEILTKIKGVNALFWATHEKLDREILDAAGPQMKVIGTMSAGFNHIDTEELKKREIKLGNTPKVLDNAVANVAVLLALGASRRFQEGRMAIEDDQWVTNHSQWLLGQDINGSTVGIVGFGGIGQTIAKRLRAFDVAKFLYTGHREKPEGKSFGAEFVSLNTLITTSDFIFACIPLTTETKNMFNADLFGKMKSNCVFVNISRGDVVDQPALVDALQKNKIFAAGLDVMTPEPLPSDHELVRLKNCVLMPHLGSATVNTRNSMSELTAKNILLGLEGKEMITPVV